MITEPTVFVLGAGASKPYRYPTGEELRREILARFLEQFNNRFAHPRDVHGIWEMTEASAKSRAADFVKAFKKSNVAIDLFLAGYPEDKWISRIGRLAICLRIFAAEREHKVKGADDNWYTLLLKNLRGGLITKEDFIGQFEQNKVTIVTFNYDRSLEHFLFESLLNSFGGITTQEVKEQMSHIKIIHVHGQILGLPWQDLPAVSEYGCQLDPIGELEASENIRVVHDPHDNPDHGTLEAAMANARHLFFLGFGYALENLAKLALSKLRPDTNIYGTAYGLRDQERQRATASIQRHLTKTKGEPTYRFRLSDEKDDCMSLLRDRL